MTKLYANPYDMHAKGFYFESFEEYEEKAEENINDFEQPVEEYKIDYIEGDNPRLFKAFSVDAGNLEQWFDDVDHIGDDDNEGKALRYLLDTIGYDFSEALARMDDVRIFEGSAEDYAYDLIDECYDLDEFALRYFDYKQFAYDLEIGGDIYELEPGVWITNANDF